MLYYKACSHQVAHCTNHILNMNKTTLRDSFDLNQTKHVASANVVLLNTASPFVPEELDKQDLNTESYNSKFELYLFWFICSYKDFMQAYASINYTTRRETCIKINNINVNEISNMLLETCFIETCLQGYVIYSLTAGQ